MIQPESFPVLVEYCRAVSAADQIALEVDRWEREWLSHDDGLGLKRWEKLLAMQDRAAARVSALATKLRCVPAEEPLW